MGMRDVELLPQAGEDGQVCITRIDGLKDGVAPSMHLTRNDYRQYLFVYAGGGEAELDRWTVSLETGDILFIPSRTIARVHWQPGVRAFLIGIADDFLISRVIPALGVPFAVFRSDFNTPKKITDWTGAGQSANRTRLWGELKEAQRRLQPIGNTVVAAYVLMMLFENQPYRGATVTQLSPSVVSVLSENNAPVREVATVMAFRSLVEQHLVDKWTVRQYCAQLDTRPIELVDACKKVFGCTPSELISDRLLLEAKRQLTYSNTPSAVIAYELGFNDPAYFSRFFKRQTGSSPSEFRRGHTGNAAL